MINFPARSMLYIFLFLMVGTNAQSQQGDNRVFDWKAGAAKVDITPPDPLWMSGYADRTEPGMESLHPLWAKFLAIEDASGEKALLISIDINLVPKTISDEIRSKIKERLGLEKAQILLNSSHTHSGPILKGASNHMYLLNEEQLVTLEKYTQHFIDLLVQGAVTAYEAMKPAKIFSGQGVSRIQVNRRNNSEEHLDEQVELKGPNDFAVPVLKIEFQGTESNVIVFGYACHGTVLKMTKWSGDFQGFAQIALERTNPGSMAMFVQGAGGDQNPLPRRSIPLAIQYGESLAASVNRVLSEELHPLHSKLTTTYEETDIEFNTLPGKSTLEDIEMKSIKPHTKRWAKLMSKKLTEGDLSKFYPYPIQIWKLGDQLIFALGGEIVTDYSLTLKEIFGKDIFVLGYSNDTMGYILTARMLREGGYESLGGQQNYGLPTTWSYSIESTIISSIIRLAKGIDISPAIEQKFNTYSE